ARFGTRQHRPPHLLRGQSELESRDPPFARGGRRRLRHRFRRRTLSCSRRRRRCRKVHLRRRGQIAGRDRIRARATCPELQRREPAGAAIGGAKKIASAPPRICRSRSTITSPPFRRRCARLDYACCSSPAAFSWETPASFSLGSVTSSKPSTRNS